MLSADILSKHKDIKHLHIRNDNWQDEKQKLVYNNKPLSIECDDVKDNIVLKEKNLA